MKNEFDFKIERSTMNDEKSIQALYQKIVNKQERIIEKEKRLPKNNYLD